MVYWRLRGKPVKHQEKKFCIARLNFGLVRVNLEYPASPRVKIEVHGEKDEKLAEAG